MARKTDIRRIRALPKEAILAMPIIDLDLPRTVKSRLSNYLAEESNLAYSPEEVTIDYLIHSKYDLEKIPAMNVVERTSMFRPSVCQKIMRVLKERYRIDYVEERLKVRRERIHDKPLAEVDLPPTVIERLTEFLSESTFGKIRPEEATITDLLHSAYDVCEMTVYRDGSKRKMFTPPVAERIVKTLEKEYEIDYAKERESFLAQHTGLDAFIIRTGLPNSRHSALLIRMHDFNATFRDLLNAPFDFRTLRRFGGTTNDYILGLFETEGIDYETSRRH